MDTQSKEALTPAQENMVKMWDLHLASEFQTKDLEATMATMTAEPSVNHVPVMTGGVGQTAVRHFYGTYFLPYHPLDTETIPVARTIGHERIVDQIIHQFTHTMEMPWILPGVPPTGKRVQIAVVAVVNFQDGKIASEHIYWDQASVLAQIGFLDSGELPIVGADGAEKVLHPSQRPSNSLIERVKRTE